MKKLYRLHKIAGKILNLIRTEFFSSRIYKRNVQTRQKKKTKTID